LQKAAAYMAGREIAFSHSKISFFGPRRVFFPTFGSFLKFTESLLRNSANFEGPLLEPTHSHQSKSRKEEAFRLSEFTELPSKF